MTLTIKIGAKLTVLAGPDHWDSCGGVLFDICGIHV